jgi:peptidoglycan-associated lipoprotein
MRRMVANRTVAKRTTLMIGLCALAVALSACPSKHKKGGPGEDGAGGLGEESLTGSSLSRAQKGLGPEEDGILKDIHFGYDSAEIESGERDRLAQNVEWLRSNTRAKIELEGHCDSRGTIEYNLGLGSKRAKSVKDYYVGQGIAADRLSTISYGKELPLCQDESEACWARNRRVHAVLLK